MQQAAIMHKRRQGATSAALALALVLGAPGAGAQNTPPGREDHAGDLVGPVFYTGPEGLDGEEAAVRTALVRLRKGEDEDLDEQELINLRIRLSRAEGAYRAAYSKLIFDEMAAADRPSFVAPTAYRRASAARVSADANAAHRLQTYLKSTPGAFERWTNLGPSGLDVGLKARIETGLRLTRVQESAAHQVITSYSPTICPNREALQLDATIESSRVHALFIGRCTSKTIYRLALLAERIAANLPSDYKRSKLERDKDVSSDLANEMARIRHELDLEEYQRLALTGLVVDPETRAPLGGILRIRIAKNAERSLIQYFDRAGRQGEYQKLWKGEPLRDLGTAMIDQIKERPDYKILRYVEFGEEPTPKELFLILANVIRTEQESLVRAYNDGYLGGDFDEVDLEQILRVLNQDVDFEENIDEVKKRLEWYLKEMDAAHDALVNARAMSPQELEQKKPGSYQLIRKMGYIEIPDGEAARARYVIPETQADFRTFAARASGGVQLPGEGMLSVVNLRNIGEAVLSVAVPELAAARAISISRRGVAISRAGPFSAYFRENVAGTLMDATMEYHRNWRDAKAGEEVKGVEWDRLILESVVLGSVLQFTGGAVDSAFGSSLKVLGRATPKSALYKFIARNPRSARLAEDFIQTGLGIASDTALTTFFQMYVQGHMDSTSWTTVMMNAALTRAVAGSLHKARIQRPLTWSKVRRHLPEDLRREFDANPRLAAETLANVKRQLAAAERTLEVFRQKNEGAAITGARLFWDLATGELNWRDLTKVVYPAMKDELGMAMEDLRVLRQTYTEAMKENAVARATRDVNRFFDFLVIKAGKEIADASKFEDKLSELNARREHELSLVREKIIAPGSDDPTSDIDRSSASAWVRRHLRAIYDADVRLLQDGDPPTAARAFDTNEYFNVIPFVAESGEYFPEMVDFIAKEGPGNLRHEAAMEALGLAAAMRFMSDGDRRSHLDNRRRTLKGRIEAGTADPRALDRFEQQVAFAEDSLAKAEAEFTKERAKIAKRHPGMRDSEIELLTLDAVYDRNLTKIGLKEFRLALIKNQNSAEALKLRAEILRDIAAALRHGIETYSSPVTVDIIVNRVQQAKLPNGDKMKTRDRLDDPNFTIEGELGEAYSESDIKAMLDDQIMFIAEHVHGFNHGHEGFYETGRALGKYLERAFLAMKIMGLDIAEVRSRPETDPHRRLLDYAQALVKVKNDPEALLDVLKDFSRSSPKSHESGMAEIFWLIEKVMPGMEGMTGVLDVKPIETSSASETRAADSTYRRRRLIAEKKWRERLTLFRALFGPDRTVQLVHAEVARAEAEIQWIEQRMENLYQLAAEYQVKDWREVLRLQNAVRESRLMLANLADPKDPLLAELKTNEAAFEDKLEDLRRPLVYRELIEPRLYKSGAGYRRLANRKDYLEDRLGRLQADLEREKKGADEARQRMGLDLAGAWLCDTEATSSLPATLAVAGDRVTLDLELPAPWTHVAKVFAERRWGAVEGVWKVLSGADIFAAGIVRALPTLDGREIQFTTASTSDPSLALNWSKLVCRRDSASQTAALSKTFVTLAFAAQAGDPDYGSWNLRQKVPAGVGPLRSKVLLRRGRRVFGQYDLEPGDYLLSVTLAGRTVTRPIAIKPGKVAEIELRPAAVRVSGPNSERLKEARLYPAGARKDALAAFRPQNWLGVVPGAYDLEVVTVHGSVWITDVELRPGQSLEVRARTGMLNVQGAPAGSSLRIRPAAVEGAGERIWVVIGDGRAGPMPPGKYELAWERDGRTQHRDVLIGADQEISVDLE